MVRSGQRADQHGRLWPAMLQRRSRPLTPAATQQLPGASVVLANGEPNVVQAGHRNHRQSKQETAAEDPPRSTPREPATPSGSWRRSPKGWYRRPGTSITGPKGPAQGQQQSPPPTPAIPVSKPTPKPWGGSHHHRPGPVDAELAETGRAIKTAATAAAKANRSNWSFGPIRPSLTQAAPIQLAKRAGAPIHPAKRHDTRRCRNAGRRFVRASNNTTISDRGTASRIGRDKPLTSKGSSRIEPPAPNKASNAPIKAPPASSSRSLTAAPDSRASRPAAWPCHRSR